MHGGTLRMGRWRLFLQRIQCGINFMSAIFISTKMQSSQRHFAIASAFRTCNTSNCWKIYAPTNCLTAGVDISSTTKKCLQWSCSFLVCFVTLVVVGPSMAVKSPLPFIRRFTEDFFMFFLCMAVLFFTKDGF
jgi:hypothetical protein